MTKINPGIYFEHEALLDDTNSLTLCDKQQRGWHFSFPERVEEYDLDYPQTVGEWSVTVGRKYFELDNMIMPYDLWRF